jgi:hypothetical protein
MWGYLPDSETMLPSAVTGLLAGFQMHHRTNYYYQMHRQMHHRQMHHLCF